MDSFELNKIIASVLLTVLIIIGIGKFTDILFHVEKPKESAYKIEGLEIVSASTTLVSLSDEEVEADIISKPSIL
jgi:cytochrome c